VNALNLLERQHRDVEKLFEAFHAGTDEASKRRAMLELCDALATHTTLEERHVYPAVRSKDAGEELREFVREHVKMKLLISQLIQEGIDEDSMDKSVRQLQREVEQHVGEEESVLFPRVQAMFTDEELGQLGDAMESILAELMAEGEPSSPVPEKPNLEI